MRLKMIEKALVLMREIKTTLLRPKPVSFLTFYLISLSWLSSEFKCIASYYSKDDNFVEY